MEVGDIVTFRELFELGMYITDEKSYYVSQKWFTAKMSAFLDYPFRLSKCIVSDECYTLRDVETNKHQLFWVWMEKPEDGDDKELPL